jgi:hypothetical protein
LGDPGDGAMPGASPGPRRGRGLGDRLAGEHRRGSVGRGAIEDAMIRPGKLVGPGTMTERLHFVNKLLN